MWFADSLAKVLIREGVDKFKHSYNSSTRILLALIKASTESPHRWHWSSLCNAMTLSLGVAQFSSPRPSELSRDGLSVAGHG